MDIEVLTRTAIPVVVIGVGGILLSIPRTRTWGRLACFLGAQTGMGLYMKQVLSGSLVAPGKMGMPAPFFVTAVQQVVCFVIMMLVWPASQLTNTFQYKPRQLESLTQWFAVVLFSLSFAMNIALNNYSVALIPISVNLIIRSCFPLPTWIAQQVTSWCTGDGAKKDLHLTDLMFMLLGCFFAALAVIAKTRSLGVDSTECKNLVSGVIVCVVSLFSGALSLALAGVLGTSLKLNEFDTVIYMAVPTAVLLIGPIFLIHHPVAWVGEGAMTDWAVTVEVERQHPSVIGLVAFSGVLALGFNLLKYNIVQSLSATHTALSGNFNKAATIIIAMVVGLEPWPADMWGILMVVSCMANIAAFTAYNVVKLRRDGAQVAAECCDDESYCEDEADYFSETSGTIEAEQGFLTDRK